MLYKALEMIHCMSEKQLLFTFSLQKYYFSLWSWVAANVSQEFFALHFPFSFTFLTGLVSFQWFRTLPWETDYKDQQGQGEQ